MGKFFAPIHVKYSYDDYERAASLERHTPLASETFKESALKDSAPVATPLFLQNCVGGNPAIFYFVPNSTFLGFRFGKRIPAFSNPLPPSDLEDPRSLLKLLIQTSLEQRKIVIADFILPRTTRNQILDRNSTLWGVINIELPGLALTALRKQNFVSSSAYL